jgi:hypothetical protein
MRLLHQLQRMRLNYGDELGATIDDEQPGPAATGDASDSRPQPGVATGGESPAPAAEESVYRSEAGATQVAGSPVGSNEPRAVSTVDFTIGRSDVASEPKTDSVVLRFRPGPGGYEVLRE